LPKKEKPIAKMGFSVFVFGVYKPDSVPVAPRYARINLKFQLNFEYFNFKIIVSNVARYDWRQLFI